MAEFIHTIGAPKIDRRATVVPVLTSTTIERPSASLASLVPMGCPKGVPPHEWCRAIVARIDALADQMNALVSVLDWMDGDSDLEVAGDELDVSWPEGFRPFDTSLSEDAEEDDVDEVTAIRSPHLGPSDTSHGTAKRSGRAEFPATTSARRRTNMEATFSMSVTCERLTR